MAHTPPDRSLAGRLSEIEEQLRSLRAGSGRVYNPDTGLYTPLATLAFGRDAASAASTVTLSTNSTTWVADQDGLTAWAEVFSGELLVTAAAKLVVSGNKATMAMSWQLYGPTAESGSTANRDDGPAAAEVAAPSTDRALSVLMDDSGQSQSVSSGYPYLHTGLAAGWYRVRPLYQLSGAVGQPNGISGTATGRTIIADPR